MRTCVDGRCGTGGGLGGRICDVYTNSEQTREGPIDSVEFTRGYVISATVVAPTTTITTAIAATAVVTIAITITTTTIIISIIRGCFCV